MNKLKALLFTLLISNAFLSFGQKEQFIGSWLGSINISGISLRIAMHISEKDHIILTKLDSPDQQSFGNSAHKTVIESDSIHVDFPLLGARYAGKLINHQLIGKFYQAGMELDLNMERFDGVVEAPKRPQIPTGPFPYSSKEVKIKTTNPEVILSGTLTIPQGKGPFPAVILVSGSGAQDRNEELMGHKPFWILADHLTRNGIAVLRYDDRGYAKSTGNFDDATTMDFADDANAVFNFLAKQKKIDKAYIGIIGHSEGGIIAPIIASKNPQVQFVVLMAGTSISGDKILIDQQELIMRANKTDEKEVTENIQLSEKIIDFLLKEKNNPNLQTDLANHIEKVAKEIHYTIPKSLSPKTFAKQTAFAYSKKWIVSFVSIDPALYLKQLMIPTLALFGEKDLQVSTRANVKPMEDALKNNPKATVHTFLDLNHLFQHAKTGSPSEYALIEETLAPEFLDFVTQWILNLNNN
jgi:uncharacterized protein